MDRERRAYQLELFGSTGFGDPQSPTPRVIFNRSDGAQAVELFNAYQPLTMDPMVDIVVSLSGGNIRLWIDSQPIFDVTDPDPVLFGGVGIHTIWEAHAQFDDFVVTPEPGTAGLVAIGLLALAGRRAQPGRAYASAA